MDSYLLTNLRKIAMLPAGTETYDFAGCRSEPIHTLNHIIMNVAFLQKPLDNSRVEQVSQQFDLPDLLLPFWGYRKKMPMHHIVRLEGQGNYTVFYFADGSQLVVSLTLKKLEGRLSSKVFARIHKKNVINLLYLKGIYASDQAISRLPVSVSLLNGDSVEVSRRKARQFMKHVRGFQQELVSMIDEPVRRAAVVA